MNDIKNTKELILSTLVADAYSLGAHWVYDEKLLLNLNVDWNELNDAKALWHKGKKAGEFTHYGDQLVWLYNFLQNKENFNTEEYTKYWFDRMQCYNGYIDGATKDTLANINEGVFPTGSSSTDLSIVGRIAPLLLVSKDKKEFLENVENFVQVTHNSNEALIASKFFAKLLVEVLEGKEILKAIDELKEEFDSKIQSYINAGINSKNEDSTTAIRNFGPACDINGGFQGVIHLLSKYDNLKEMLICNAKAGGETSARAMLATLIFMAQEDKKISQIPPSWLNIRVTII
ncbi:hypothetical protein CRV01_04585 [Arcobacter sp. CECT 8983]|uniref:ADP-ribosylglycohydrolase family protein n=1 Tax=Arcobacter sp. CECT 8983 TaxID=2044508 RepID=UPI00100B8793|nr:ADP-ribosylglycohydrolase family protein [Arcobacter sp. CECT 8983]RXJ90441.1 hypothetical protein CRV01_04585 [Arcobacter sp. CECT 8983]